MKRARWIHAAWLTLAWLCGLPPQWERGARLMEQPLPQCWSTNSVPRAFFPQAATGCRLSLKIEWNLSPSWEGGLIGGYIWYDVKRRYGIWIYRSAVVAASWWRHSGWASTCHKATLWLAATVSAHEWHLTTFDMLQESCKDLHNSSILVLLQLCGRLQ